MISLIDKEDNLQLWYYNNCKDDSPDIIKRVRGLIFNEEGDIIMSNIPYMKEIIVDYSTNIDIDISLFKYFSFYEGMIIRVFYYNGKWFISSDKKINIEKISWAEKKNYLELFKSAIKTELNLFLNSLDKTRQYLFLLRSTGLNRIVSHIREDDSLVYHIGTFIDGSLCVDDVIEVQHLPEHKFANCGELKTFILNLNPLDIMGLLCLSDHPIRFISKIYYTLYKLRGNTPDLSLRYLELRHRGEFDRLQIFKTLYIEYIHNFTEIEQKLRDLSQYIHKLYIKKYILKDEINTTDAESHLLKRCHIEYVTSREPTTVEKVYNIIGRQSASRIYELIFS